MAGNDQLTALDAAFLDLGDVPFPRAKQAGVIRGVVQEDRRAVNVQSPRETLKAVEEQSIWRAALREQEVCGNP